MMTTLVQVDAEDLSLIQKASALFAASYDVILFGSRARRDAREHSDVDLAVFGIDDFFDPTTSNLGAVLAELTIRPRCSVVAMHSVSERFITHVLTDGVIIHEGGGHFRKLRAKHGLAPPLLAQAATVPETAP